MGIFSDSLFSVTPALLTDENRPMIYFLCLDQHWLICSCIEFPSDDEFKRILSQFALFY